MLWINENCTTLSPHVVGSFELLLKEDSHAVSAVQEFRGFRQKELFEEHRKNDVRRWQQARQARENFEDTDYPVTDANPDIRCTLLLPPAYETGQIHQRKHCNRQDRSLETACSKQKILLIEFSELRDVKPVGSGWVKIRSHDGLREIVSRNACDFDSVNLCVNFKNVLLSEQRSHMMVTAAFEMFTDNG